MCNLPIAASTPCSVVAHDLLEQETSLYLPSTLLEETETSTKGMKWEEPIDHLNSFLRSRDVSPIRYTLKTPWNDASGRTRRLHERKAKQAVSAVLGETAPNDPDLLWESIMNETGNHTCSSGLDKELMYTLANCYKNANEWDSRRQILSIMADKVSLATIQQCIPGMRSYRFKVARQHAAVHGSGKLVPTNAQTKSFIPEAKLAHFLDFITSSHVIQDLPFGAKTITLSTNEVIQVPNVVRNMIPERIVCQYQKYSAEHDFTPMSRSTLLRILHVFSASTRKSLQGLDYVSCSGAQAFEDLVNVVHQLGENGMGLAWAKTQKEALKEAKRYLKTDFKVK